MANGYIDKYDKSSTATSFKNRILGDATGEMGPFYSYLESNGINYIHSSWYGDYAVFIDSSNPWFFRGGYWGDGGLAGQLYFVRYPGSAYGNIGFRIALAPTFS